MPRGEIRNAALRRPGNAPRIDVRNYFKNFTSPTLNYVGGLEGRDGGEEGGRKGEKEEEEEKE